MDGYPPSTAVPMANPPLIPTVPPGPGVMPPSGDPHAGDLPAMSHQMVAPPAKVIEPQEYSEPQWSGAGG